MNKLYQQFNQLSKRQLQQPNSIGDLYKQLQGAGDKNSFMMNLMKCNPQLKQVIDLVQQNGGNAEQVFYRLAQEKGINPASILNSLK